MLSRFFWTIRVPDARARRVPLVAKWPLQWPRDDRDALARESRRLMTWHSLPKRRVFVSVILTVAAICIFAFLPTLLTSGASKLFRASRLFWLALPAGLIIGVGQSWFFVNIIRWVTADIYSQAIVAIGRCASCAYPLDLNTPSADGFTVCPECGAAWNAGLKM